MKISVIVPAYNAGQYLSKCVDSILNQTYKDFEVILIDDGSRDETPVICDSLAALDKRVTVIHKANEGPGAARQTGIATAKGEYIAFVDADDYIDPEMFRKLSDYAARENADIVQCGHVKIGPEGRYINKVEFESRSVEGNQECIAFYAKGRIVTDFLWDKLFKATLFQDVISPKFYYSEDICVLTQLFGKANKVVIIHEQLYYYVMSSGGLSRKKFSLQSLDTVKAGEFIFKYYSEKFPDLIVLAKLYICSQAAQNYCGLLNFKSDRSGALKLDMLRVFHQYYDNKSFCKQRILNNVSLNRWLFITSFNYSPTISAFIFRKVYREMF